MHNHNIVSLYSYNVLTAMVAARICMCMKQIWHLWVSWVSSMVRNRKKSSSTLT